MNEPEPNAGTPEKASSLHEVGMRMWRVTVERTLMVMAADERAAEREATYYATEEDSEPELVAARAVSSVEDIPLEWRDGIPWGGDRKDDRTCSQRVDSHTVRISDAPLQLFDSPSASKARSTPSAGSEPQ